jgi:hypothetical protein
LTATLASKRSAHTPLNILRGDRFGVTLRGGSADGGRREAGDGGRVAAGFSACEGRGTSRVMASRETEGTSSACDMASGSSLRDAMTRCWCATISGRYESIRFSTATLSIDSPFGLPARTTP